MCSVCSKGTFTFDFEWCWWRHNNLNLKKICRDSSLVAADAGRLITCIWTTENVARLSWLKGNFLLTLASMQNWRNCVNVWTEITVLCTEFSVKPSAVDTLWSYVCHCHMLAVGHVLKSLSELHHLMEGWIQVRMQCGWWNMECRTMQCILCRMLSAES